MRKTYLTLVLALAAVLVLCAGAAADAVAVSYVSDAGFITCELVRLGSYTSDIKVNGEAKTVLTETLSWSTNASPDQRLAYLYAPSIGSVNIRLTKKPRSGIVAKGQAGRVVMVFDKGKDYTGIVYDGEAGYVQNSVLRFIENPAAARTTATVSYKGKMTGSTKITMRSDAELSSHAIIKIRLGETVIVLKKGRYWTETEYNGWHGYVRNTCLTFNEEPPAVTEEKGDIRYVEEDEMLDDDEGLLDEGALMP